MNIQISNLFKSYGSLNVFSGLNISFNDCKISCLMSPSGTGKTTLFRIMLGLEKADSGDIYGLEDKKISFVFQEDRLCDSFSAIENVMLVMSKKGEKEYVIRELSKLLPAESIKRPVSTLSGGMKRRVSICRALLAPSDMIFMDEPFTGLDEDTKANVIKYILEKTKDKLLIISTHQNEDVELLHGQLITI